MRIFTGLVDAAEQLSVTGGGFPMYSAQAVAGLPFSNASGTHRVFENTPLRAAVAKGVFSGQAHLGHGIDPRIDDNVLAVAPLGSAGKKSEAVAGADGYRPIGMIAPLGAMEGHVALETLKSARHPKSKVFTLVSGGIDHDLALIHRQASGENIRNL